jgi:CheY-like chemotaxis protein
MLRSLRRRPARAACPRPEWSSINVQRQRSPRSGGFDGGRQGRALKAEKTASDGTLSCACGPVVLVIDDDEMVRFVLQQVLEDAGYRVMLAADGRAGLAIAQAETVDLIITDIVMPELDGLELIRSLTARGGAPPIIAVSGGRRINDQNPLMSAVDLGAAAAREKPFDPDDMLALVRAHALGAPSAED